METYRELICDQCGTTVKVNKPVMVFCPYCGEGYKVDELDDKWERDEYIKTGKLV
jgi:uncharacterized Zn finger protein (UPF0148 family)